MVLDDTEKAEEKEGTLINTLKGVVHVLPGGQSEKNISRRGKISAASVEHVRAFQQPQVHFGLARTPLEDEPPATKSGSSTSAFPDLTRAASLIA